MEPSRGGFVGLAVLLALLLAARADEKGLASFIENIELEYEDQCNDKGEHDWRELMGEPGALRAKLEQDKAISKGVSTNIYDLKSYGADVDLNSPNNTLLARKYELLMNTGDSRLEIDQWAMLVSFADESVHRLETSRDYDCGGDPNKPCTLSDVRNKLASEKGDGVRKRIKTSWEKQLPDANYYVTQILPLLNVAARANEYDTVEAYWGGLVEYEGALVKARELWNQVLPLYQKLHRYVADRLASAGYPINTDTSIPVRSLGSLLGDDWSNALEHVLPEHSDVYRVIKKNLVQKHMGGREAFVQASKLLEELKLGPTSSKFWIYSVFDKTCPTKLVDFCSNESLRAFSCNDISLPNYLDAHEALMKVKYAEVVSSLSNNSYILRESGRYSAVHEAITGMASVLALSPNQLDRSRLVPIKYFEKNPDHNSLVIQMILALRDLPRLNYYLAADEWRIKTLKEFPAPIPLGQSWSSYRRAFSLVEPGDKDFLGDPHILHNRPYLAKFYGIILKYQIYQWFYEYSFDHDVVRDISEERNRILEPMMRAFSVKWPDLVSDILAKKSYVVNSYGLNDYFSLLSNHLDAINNPDTNNIPDSFDEPGASDIFEATSEKQPEEIENEKDNEVDNIKPMEAVQHEKEDIRYDSENVLANKHKIEKEDVQAKQEESSSPLQNKGNSDPSEITQAGANNVYLWVGIAVVILIILILITIIVKKRHSHRKQLDRERKQQSKA